MSSFLVFLAGDGPIAPTLVIIAGFEPYLTRLMSDDPEAVCFLHLSSHPNARIRAILPLANTQI